VGEAVGREVAVRGWVPVAACSGAAVGLWVAVAGGLAVEVAVSMRVGLRVDVGRVVLIGVRVAVEGDDEQALRSRKREPTIKRSMGSPWNGRPDSVKRTLHPL
jgi:hypothetical protein